MTDYADLQNLEAKGGEGGVRNVFVGKKSMELGNG